MIAHGPHHAPVVYYREVAGERVRSLQIRIRMIERSRLDHCNDDATRAVRVGGGWRAGREEGLAGEGGHEEGEDGGRERKGERGREREGVRKEGGSEGGSKVQRRASEEIGRRGSCSEWCGRGLISRSGGGGVGGGVFGGDDFLRF